jgi:hypothetical protein
MAAYRPRRPRMCHVCRHTFYPARGATVAYYCSDLCRYRARKARR